MDDAELRYYGSQAHVVVMLEQAARWLARTPSVPGHPFVMQDYVLVAMDWILDHANRPAVRPPDWLKLVGENPNYWISVTVIGRPIVSNRDQLWTLWLLEPLIWLRDRQKLPPAPGAPFPGAEPLIAGWEALPAQEQARQIFEVWLQARDIEKKKARAIPRADLHAALQAFSPLFPGVEFSTFEKWIAADPDMRRRRGRPSKKTA